MSPTLEPRTPFASNCNDQVIVTDVVFSSIDRFQSDGLFLGSWGSFGSGDGEFDGPKCVDTHPDGSVFVVDVDNNRMQKWGEGVTSSTPDDPAWMDPSVTGLALQTYPNPFQSRLWIGYHLPPIVDASLRVYGVAGNLVTTLVEGPSETRHGSIVWNGRNSEGPVPPRRWDPGAHALQQRAPGLLPVGTHERARSRPWPEERESAGVALELQAQRGRC